MEKRKKQRIIIIISAAGLAAAIIGIWIYHYCTRYNTDPEDTEARFLERVDAVGYENTVDGAYPETDIHSIIEAHFKGELAPGKTEKKAIIIGYDGCRADILNERSERGGVEYLISSGGSINLAYCGGVNYPEENTQDTSTAPGWCSMLTGVFADVHGITGNGITKEVEPKTLMTSLYEDGVIDSSAFITMWQGHFENEDSTYRAEKEYCEENGIDVDFVRRKTYGGIHRGAIKEVKSDECADFILAIYENTDAAGHRYGFSYNNPIYERGFRKEDSYGYDLIKAIEARDTYDTEDWLIIITSDHGGIGTTHGGDSIQERMIFVVMNKEWE